MGMIHYLAAARLKGAKVAAISSRDAKKRAGDWRGIKGNFGPAGEQMDLGSIERYSRLEDPQIDLVDICKPPNDHKAAVIAALVAVTHSLFEQAQTRRRGRSASMM